MFQHTLSLSFTAPKLLHLFSTLTESGTSNVPRFTIWLKHKQDVGLTRCSTVKMQGIRTLHDKLPVDLEHAGSASVQHARPVSGPGGPMVADRAGVGESGARGEAAPFPLSSGSAAGRSAGPRRRPGRPCGALR